MASGDSPGLSWGSSQSRALGIVYELDTLRHKARRISGQLSSVILGGYANKSKMNTTERCQVAAGTIWDEPLSCNLPSGIKLRRIVRASRIAS